MDLSTVGGVDTHGYIIRLCIKLFILVTWFSSRLGEYSRMAQEAAAEAAEERRLVQQQALQTSQMPATFPQFSCLPPELRHQIWEEALPGRRVLMLRSPGFPANVSVLSEFRSLFADPCTVPTSPDKARSHDVSTRRRRKSINVWTCSAPIPATLHVNSESRAVALKHYRLGLAPGSTQPRIYINFERDVIGISDDLLYGPATRNLWRLTDDLKKVTSLCLSAGAAVALLGPHRPYALKRVEELAIVSSPLWANGVVPKVAQMDYDHWIVWQNRQRKARWPFGRSAEKVKQALGEVY